jgi:hypothetical protein
MEMIKKGSERFGAPQNFTFVCKEQSNAMPKLRSVH